MRAFVLNLARRPERLQRFCGWNDGHGLDFQVVPAVDGTGLDRAALAAAGVLEADNARFTDGAIGNALSHRQQWLDCMADGQPRMICEDDACLRGDIAAHLPAVTKALLGADLLFLGYNTNAPLTLVLPDALVTESYFGMRPGAGDHFAAFAGNTARRPRPALQRALTVWGTIAYAVSPAGARRLVQSCFPLSSARGVSTQMARRRVAVRALDGMINLALHDGRVHAVACLPPLALSPNDCSDVSASSACP